MWVYLTDEFSGSPQMVLFDYERTRAGYHPVNFLRDGFHGYLTCDGYQAYHSLGEGIIVSGCLTHARRRFDAALTALKKDFTKEQLKETVAYQAMSRIGILYKIEEMIHDKTPEEKWNIGVRPHKADRCLCVDEKGNVITGDHILYIYGCYMKERGKLLNNTVVTTVMSNFGLYKAFDEQGIGYAKTAVGDKYVYEYMAKNGCRIGGEQSGHIIFSKYASTGDGILTSLKMMEVMLAKKKSMSELAAPLKIYPQVLENVRVTDKKAAQNDPAVQEAVNTVAEALGDTGRILVRESGTEPVVRVMVEAPDHDTCQKYVDEVVNVICEKGYKA